jgi:hypothetical protein
MRCTTSGAKWALYDPTSAARDGGRRAGLSCAWRDKAKEVTYCAGVRVELAGLQPHLGTVSELSHTR